MTLRKTLNICLAALLVGAICLIGGTEMVKYYRQLGYAFLVTYRQQLPENPTPADALKARIKSFESAVNVNLTYKVRSQVANAKIQQAMGKQQIAYGGSNMVTTEQGYLYDLFEDTAKTQEYRDQTLKGLKEVHDALAEQNITVFYGYAHGTMYDGMTLPEGTEDDNNEAADIVVDALRSYGIETLDSRQLVRDAGLPLDQVVMRTDAHWTPRAAFEMYTALVDLLNEKTAVKADRAAADIKNFNESILPKAHISDIGIRFGEGGMEGDDFQIITPKFDTDIRRVISYDNQRVGIESEGKFEDVVLDPSMLPEAQGKTPVNCYNYYGQHPYEVFYHNEAAPEGRVLIVKDSFGTPVSSFMALAVRDVCAIDLRKTQKTVLDYVASFKPDAVVFVQCQEVMRSANFVFVNKE